MQGLRTQTRFSTFGGKDAERVRNRSRRGHRGGNEEAGPQRRARARQTGPPSMPSSRRRSSR
jgi:hypothetical protein